MIANAPYNQQQRPVRLLVLPKNGPIFGYWLVMIQVLGPNTIFIGSNQSEAGDNQQGTAIDGLQLTQANSSTVSPFAMFLWHGELWVSGSAPNTQFVIVVPGQEKENLPIPECEADDQ